jgi:hypothetical protein
MEKSWSDEVKVLLRARHDALRALVVAWNGAVRDLERAVSHQERLERRLEARITRLTGLTPRERSAAQRRLDDRESWPSRMSTLPVARLLACRARIEAIEAEMAPELGQAAQRVADARAALRAASRALLDATTPGEAEALTGRSRRSLAHQGEATTTPEPAHFPGISQK